MSICNVKPTNLKFGQNIFHLKCKLAFFVITVVTDTFLTLTNFFYVVCKFYCYDEHLKLKINVFIFFNILKITQSFKITISLFLYMTQKKKLFLLGGFLWSVVCWFRQSLYYCLPQSLFLIIHLLQISWRLKKKSISTVRNCVSVNLVWIIVGPYLTKWLYTLPLSLQ